MSLPITSKPALLQPLPGQPVLQPMLQLLFLCCWCSLLFLLPTLSACSLSVVDFLSGLMGQWRQGLMSWGNVVAVHSNPGQVSKFGKAGQARFVSCLGLRLRLASRCRFRPYRGQLRG